MLQDFHEWLEDETDRLEAAGQSDTTAFAQRALARFEDATVDTLYVAIDKGAARRALTALQLVQQQTTAELPALIELREAIKTAFAEAMEPIAHDHEPLEAEVL
jgi:hypothetical protein